MIAFRDAFTEHPVSASAGSVKKMNANIGLIIDGDAVLFPRGYVRLCWTARGR